MQDVSPSPAVARMSYDEAVRSFGQQRGQLDELRSRTGTLISAASIATAFLGAAAANGTRHGHLPLVFLWALIPFGVAICTCIAILLPRQGWAFALRTKSLEAYDDLPVTAVQRILAHTLEKAIDENDARLTRMSQAFAVAAVAMLWSIVAWIVIIE